MTREELADKLQEIVGRLMALEQIAREAGEEVAVRDMETARRFVVLAAQSLEPPPER